MFPLSEPLSADPDVVSAVTVWSAQVSPADHVPLADIILDASSQCSLTAPVHQRRFAELDPGDTRTRIFRALLGARGAKQWLSCPHSVSLQTHISDLHFRTCSVSLDIFGDDLFMYKSGFRHSGCPYTRRHDVTTSSRGCYLTISVWPQATPLLSHASHGVPQAPSLTSRQSVIPAVRIF